MNRPETPKMRDWQRRNFAAAVKKKVTDIEATFKAFDMDGSGKISHPEFIQAVRVLLARRAARVVREWAGEHARANDVRGAERARSARAG